MANQEENQIPSHFFRAILSLENARMKIPSNFVKQHGNTMSEDAILQVGPGKLSWKLGVERSEGLVWLIEGWKEFAEYYSIKFGHILMFRYKGKSKFDVSIFDPSLMEIRYPVKASRKSRVEFDQSKVVETEEDETDDDEEEEEESPQRLQKTKEKSHAKQSSEKRTQRPIDAWTRVYARAMTFESSNPYFVVRMQPNYVASRKCILCIPNEHSKKHICGKENKGMFLVGEDGMRWFVNYSIGNPPRLQVRLLTSGWSVFVKTNLLQTGDVCLFELVDSADMVYKVTIFHIVDYKEKEEQEREEQEEEDYDEEEEDKEESDDYDECPQKQHKTKEKSRANQSRKKRTRRATSAWDKVLKRAEAYKSSHPCFSVRMLPKSLLCVPHSHSIRHFLGKENKGVYLKVGENRRAWFVKYCIGSHPFHQVRLLKFEWSIFMKDNHLEHGDICIFELINSTKMVYKVAIFRIAAAAAAAADDDDDDDDDDDECPPVNQSKEKRSQYSRSARNIVRQRAHAFKCQNPSFRAVMKHYHLRSMKSCLYVPVPHAKMYLLEKGNGAICLTNGKDQRTWYVSYSIGAPPFFRVRLSTSGWRPFKDDNHLEAGDVCVFELVDSSRMEYKVTIFHVADYA